MDRAQRDAFHRLSFRQHGVVTLGQARELGISAEQMEGAVDRGELRRIRQRVYLPAGRPRSLKTEIMADLLACRRRARAARSTVLLLLGLEMQDLPLRRELVVEGSARPRVASPVMVHRTVDLPAIDTMLIDGIPATTCERAIIDLASVVRWDQRVEMVDVALHRGKADRQLLLERAEMLEPGRPGVRGVRAIASTRGPQRFRSEIERAGRPLLIQAGMTDVVMNTRPLRAPEAGEMDAVSEAHAAVVEFDGLRYHGLGLDRQRDNEKSNALSGRYRLLRFTWTDVVRRPHVVRAQAAALVRGGRPAV